MIPNVEKCLEVSHEKGLESKAELQERDFKREIGVASKAHGKGQNFFNYAFGQKGRMRFSFRKNAYAFSGQPSRCGVQINATKWYHFASVRRAILTRCIIWKGQCVGQATCPIL